MATKLHLVTGDQPRVKPLRKLGKPGANLWRSVMSEFEISDAAGLEMLTMACEQLDRAQDCREQIDRDGLMFKTKSGPKNHPLLKDELAARAFVCRTLQRLGLNLEAVKPVGRPPRGIGWLPDDDD
jgi:hypothetical protein